MPGRLSKLRKATRMKAFVHPPLTRDPIDTRRYGGKWVAIWQREIIDSDNSLDALCDRLAAVGLEEKAALMAVPLPGRYWA